MNKINLKYGLEEITARVPGLFPYIEFDENGVSELHPASDSEAGCYGKIASSIVLPNDVNLVVDGETVLDGGNDYTYPTLMRLYYQYRDSQPDSSFILFMEKGIGRFKIDAPIDFNKCTLVLEYEYYANTPRLFDEYTKIGLMCHKYNEYKRITGNINCELECLLDKYARMGGDDMKLYYENKVAEMQEISDEYFTYAGGDFDLHFSLNIVSTSNDLGILQTYIDYFDPNRPYSYGESVIHNDRTYVCDVEIFKGEWDDTKFHLLSEEYTPQSSKLTGITNSQLTGFRGITNYLSEGGSILTPSPYEDWLWYYRIGDLGHYETTTDSLGNIEVNGTRVDVVGEYENHLMAYGDVITKITRDTDNMTVTIEYVVGAHFKAKYKGDKTDDDDNVYYFYGDYEYDFDDDHGVLYTETYPYEPGGEIDSLDDDEFELYITTKRRVDDMYKKCAFSIVNNMNVGELTTNGVSQEYQYISSYFSANMSTEKDSLVSPTTKFDFLTGVAYKPTVKSDVYVGRGNAAAWERHIKLSEVKTFEDLETYSNGGFFNLR